MFVRCRTSRGHCVVKAADVAHSCGYDTRKSLIDELNAPEATSSDYQHRSAS